MDTVTTQGVLNGKRILVCGKGGSGKSTFVALAAAALQRKRYDVVVLDGDASNPEGLVRLLFGIGVEGEPSPLIDFFGGIERVTCPVDDPAPLTRLEDSTPVPDSRIDLFGEIPADYYLRRGHMTLLQVGKINQYGQGCDGPVEKVVRDFLITGDAVNLIDMKAGIEHFGRRVPDRVDIILCVLDCTLESVSIAVRIADFCAAAGDREFWLILNKIDSPNTQALLQDRLGGLSDRVLGVLSYNKKLMVAAFSEKALVDSPSVDEAETLIEALEQRVLAGGTLPKKPETSANRA
jgi:CO dehydrogenase maturation factor